MFTSESKTLRFPIRMHKAAVDIFKYLSEAPKDLGIIEFGVFGSVARQKARYNSDLDILIVCDGNFRAIRYYCAHERCTGRTDIQVDVLLTDRDFSTASLLLRENLKRDYVPIWRREDEVI